MFGNKSRIRKLEAQLADVIRAFEWHMNSSLEIVLAEEKIIKLKLAERKKLLEETGNTETVTEQMEGMVVHDPSNRTEVGREPGCN